MGISGMTGVKRFGALWRVATFAAVLAVSQAFAIQDQFGLVGATKAAAASSFANAGAFLADLSQRASSQLNEAGLSDEEKQRRFRTLLTEGFDVAAIGRFVLGRYWRGASEDERREFLQTFEDTLVFRFLPILGEYADDTLKVDSVRPFADAANIFSVESQLKRKSGPPVRLDWRIHQGANGYQILDVVAEGVSVAVTLRAEYNAVLKQNGGKVSELNAALRKMIAGL